MNGDGYLLDTNIFVEILNGTLEVPPGHVTFLSSIVLGELYYGAHKSRRVERNLARLQDLFRQYRQREAFVGCTEATANHYGLVKKGLRESGRPIPDNDIWLAAKGFEYGLVLVSRDHHFDYVQSLAWETW